MSGGGADGGGGAKGLALAGYRVVDLSWVRAGPWAARILGTLGADVIKVEWPAPGTVHHQDRCTTAGMPEDARPSVNGNHWFSEKHADKRSVTLNLRRERGRGLLRRLLAVSDAVVENYSSGVMRRWGLGYGQLREINPGLVYVSMSGLGHAGRDHGYRTYGPSAQALAGLTHASGLPGEPPAGWGWSYLDDTGGVFGAIAVAGALYRRRRSGRGQHVDLSQVGLGIGLAGAAVLDATANGRPARREGFPPGNRARWPGAPPFDACRGPAAAPHNAYRTAPGGYNDWCAVVCRDDREWRALAAVMGGPAWAADARFATLAGRLERQEELDARIGDWTRTLGKYELAERCQAAGVPAMPVQSNEDRVERDPQLRHRGLFARLPHPVLGEMGYQNLPWRSSHAATAARRAGPLLGEHNREVFCGLLGLGEDELRAGYADGTLWPADLPPEPYLLADPPAGAGPPVPPPAAPAPPPPRGAGAPGGARGADGPPAAADAGAGAPRGPFAGLRVVELAGERGQWCGRLLAELGADVIKVEPPGGCPERDEGPFWRDEPHRERSLAFWHCNWGKRGVTLDPGAPDGAALFRRLVRSADVLLETTPPGWLAERGLAPESLRAADPRLIHCALTPFGQDGPWRDFETTDLVHFAAGGQMASSGYDADDLPDAPPIAPGGGNAWRTGGHYALLAIAAALLQRDAGGEGQYLDASIHDACALTTEMAVPIYFATRRVLRRQTGRHAAWSLDRPRTQFRCADGRYVNAMFNQRLSPARLRDIAEWLDRYGAAADLLDERFRDQQTVIEEQEHISDVLRAFFPRITAEEAYRGAQARGLAWGAVRSIDEILADPHWEDRGYWADVEIPELGVRVRDSGPWAIWSESPLSVARRAPLAGEHNAEVYGALGLAPAELEALRAAGAI